MAQSDKPTENRPQMVEDLVAALVALGINIVTAAPAAPGHANPTPANDAQNGNAANEPTRSNAASNTQPWTEWEVTEDEPPRRSGFSSAPYPPRPRAPDAAGTAPTASRVEPGPVPSHPGPCTPAVGADTGANTSAVAGATLGNNGFVCSHCSNFNQVRIGKTWYVVTIGLQVGVFSGWHLVQPLVSGVSGACFHKYPTEAIARAAFAEALNAGLVMIVMSSPVTTVQQASGSGATGGD